MCPETFLYVHCQCDRVDPLRHMDPSLHVSKESLGETTENFRAL